MHDALEIGIVLSGAMRRTYQSWQTIVRPGDVWLCGTWEPHGYQVLKQPCHVAVCLVWPPSLHESYRWGRKGVDWLLPFTAAPASRPRATRASRPRLLELGKRFRAICRETKSHRELRLQLLMLETILELMDQWQPSLRPQVDTDGYARIRSAVGMASSSRKFVSIEQAAAACGLKRNALGRLFQAVMGIGFAQFALRYRLSGAANQLRCSDDPIKAVAADWGFTDDSHLHRLIRRHYGVTPLEYRRS